MYAKEFEDLLKEYLTDGIITSKERQVLLKKAKELGYDVDEVDLYIDAQQQKCDQAVEAASAKKRGKTCPRCGASVQTMQLTCPECGFEFNNKEANASAKELIKELNKAKDVEDKIEIISNYPVPNTKENLAEFVALCIGNCQISFTELYDDEKPKICLAWRALSQQVVTKAHLMLKDDLMLMEQVNKLEKLSTKKMPLHGGLLWILTCIIGFVLFFGILFLKAPSADKESDQNSEVSISGDQIIQQKISDVSKLVKDGDLSGADEYLNNLTLPDSLQDKCKDLNPAYQTVINAYIKDNDYDSAESLALIFRGKLNNDFRWEETPIYHSLKAKYKAAGRDFSVLKSKYDTED